MRHTPVYGIGHQLTTRLLIITAAAVLSLMPLSAGQAIAASYAATMATGTCADIPQSQDPKYQGMCYVTGGSCACPYDSWENIDYYTLIPQGYYCPNGGTLSGSTCYVYCTSPRYPAGWQTWTDSTITAGATQIKGTHITELRTNINLMRVDSGLAACSWTDPVLSATSIAVRKVHIDEMRACISAVYTTCGQAVPTFTDSTITSGTTPIKAVHINEIRTVTGNAP